MTASDEFLAPELPSKEALALKGALVQQNHQSEGLAKASHAPPAEETGAVYAALSAELAACRLSAFRPESCQKPANTPRTYNAEMQVPGSAQADSCWRIRT